MFISSTNGSSGRPLCEFCTYLIKFGHKTVKDLSQLSIQLRRVPHIKFVNWQREKMSFFNSNNPFRHAAAGQSTSAPPTSNVDDVAPPPGPPPSHQQRPNSDDFAPPPGPPPTISSHQQQQQADYAPPPGPPPSYSTNDFAPPPGPPPPSSAAQHDWQSVVPDTSLFPPPPALFSGYERSSASNASADQAAEGDRWCKRYPLAPPIDLQRQQGLYQFHFQRDGKQQQQPQATRLIQPETNTFRGTLQPKQPGIWSLVTEKKAGDATVIGYPPLYLVQRDSPLLPSSSSSSSPTKTIYYECKILAAPPAPSAAPHHHPHRLLHHGNNNKGPNNDTGEIGLALGFTALPFPPFRMPGWHRGSLAVHGDDGHKYVNDGWGGKEFTAPFRPGETVGIGMTFSSSSTSSSNPPSYDQSGKGKGGGGDGGGGGRIEVEVFFTRDGKVDGRWDVHEELDASTDLPVTGLEGYHDIAIAVGTYQNVGVEIVLDPARWMYRGVQH